ncbi:hypothetical protein ERJ75_000668400 [Trypanosoma vivax]|nr:hypothetical protein ERJ75_000668400 [Trypanosoma vivax]
MWPLARTDGTEQQSFCRAQVLGGCAATLGTRISRAELEARVGARGVRWRRVKRGDEEGREGGREEPDESQEQRTEPKAREESDGKGHLPARGSGSVARMLADKRQEEYGVNGNDTEEKRRPALGVVAVGQEGKRPERSDVWSGDWRGFGASAGGGA